MKRYSKNPALIVLNIIIEYFLIIASYGLCCLLRLNISEQYASKFYPYVAKMFLPAILILDLIMVGTYLVLGDYRTLHFANIKRILIKTFSVSVVGGFGMAMFIFLSEGTVFSRLLLVMLIPAWTVILFIKRIFLEFLANRIFANQIATCNTLIVGSNRNARKYYEGLKEDSSSRTSYIGYVADKQNGEMGNYLGGEEVFEDILRNDTVDRVIIVEDDNNRSSIRELINICSVYGIEAIVIPIYADCIAEGQVVRKEHGIHYLSVNAGLTSDILGVNISVTDMDKTLSEIEDNLDKWRGKYICVSNVHTTVMAYDNPEYKAVQNGAIRALPDGGPLSSYSRSEGKMEARRVTGPDLMRECLKKSREKEWHHFFYGSTEKTLDMLKEKIEKDYPGAVVAGMISPPYREITPQENEEYVRKINEAKPDFLWVGLGAPKQEIWMAAHKDKINALMIGVGAAFDYESGNLKRAPEWMQRCNLEWMYRFMQEPKRLFKRYFITNIKFLWLTRR